MDNIENYIDNYLNNFEEKFSSSFNCEEYCLEKCNILDTEDTSFGKIDLVEIDKNEFYNIVYGDNSFSFNRINY